MLELTRREWCMGALATMLIPGRRALCVGYWPEMTTDVVGRNHGAWSGAFGPSIVDGLDGRSCAMDGTAGIEVAASPLYSQTPNMGYVVYSCPSAGQPSGTNAVISLQGRQPTAASWRVVDRRLCAPRRHKMAPRLCQARRWGGPMVRRSCRHPAARGRPFRRHRAHHPRWDGQSVCEWTPDRHDRDWRYDLPPPCRCVSGCTSLAKPSGAVASRPRCSIAAWCPTVISGTCRAAKRGHRAAASADVRSALQAGAAREHVRRSRRAQGRSRAAGAEQRPEHPLRRPRAHGRSSISMIRRTISPGSGSIAT